tara:strand:+ start:417 stop:1079 length:663 start_codon:yes stop_codon:yes gene_type:complete
MEFFKLFIALLKTPAISALIGASIGFAGGVLALIFQYYVVKRKDDDDRKNEVIQIASEIESNLFASLRHCELAIISDFNRRFYSRMYSLRKNSKDNSSSYDIEELLKNVNRYREQVIDVQNSMINLDVELISLMNKLKYYIKLSSRDYEFLIQELSDFAPSNYVIIPKFQEMVYMELLEFDVKNWVVEAKGSVRIEFDKRRQELLKLISVKFREKFRIEL